MPFSENRHHVIAEWLEQKGGYRFKDIERLDRALTHSSARGQASLNYERLEFLGDRILGLLIAEVLFAAFPQADEGELSLRFNQLVDAKTCAAIASELELPRLIRAGLDLGSPDAKHLVNVRADVMESLIAAIYLDGGIDAARAFVTRFWSGRIDNNSSARRDAKTELQEWAHRDSATAPVYTILSRDGPDHDPNFSISVTVADYVPEVGKGRSKRFAEQDAAQRFLVARSVWTDDGDAGDE
ncbi:MAG: ribonuclease III [Rhizobiaceae bacterium]